MGAMACAVCGAKSGLSGLPADKVAELERINGLDFRALARRVVDARKTFRLEA